MGYLLYDRYYETQATISVSASDPQNPFLFPFTITNNSHLFKIRNVRWECSLINVFFENGPAFISTTISVRSKAAVIDEGKNLNFSCSLGNSLAKVKNSGKVVRAMIAISLKYEMDILFGEKLHPKTPPMRFTWIPSASNPQWIKGDFAEGN